MEYIEFLSGGTPNPDLLGGKGSNLIKLVEIGANVPPGFIVNTNAFKKFVEESEDQKKLLVLLSNDLEPKKIMQHSAEIQDLIVNSKIPWDVMDEIKLMLDQVRENTSIGASFAVRSSATLEDSSQFSFAGQADSYLYNNTLDEIFNSIKLCWASLFSPRAMLYFLQIKKKGVKISLLEVQMAVVMQKMVNSEIAGVLFTANVINNDEGEMLINSTWGLGGTIADNLVIPDTIVIKKDKFEIVKTIVGKKEKKSIRNPEDMGTIMVENDPQARTICSLNESQLRQLHEIGLKLEESFQYPQDIEWAFENDVLFILQTRPITTLAR